MAAPKPYRVPLAQRLGNPSRLSSPREVSDTFGSQFPTDPAAGWHPLAFSYFDSVPEQHYYSLIYGGFFSRIGLRLGWLGDDEEPGPVYDAEGKIKKGIPSRMATTGTQLVRGLRARPGGQSAFMRGMGRIFSLTGDMYVIGRDTPYRHFEVCSTDEVRPSANYKPNKPDSPKWSYRDLPGATWQDLPADTFVLRIHDPHPRFKRWSTSSTRPLLNVLERLSLLDQEALSAIRSRLANGGLWIIDDSIELPPEDGDDPDVEPFTAMLMKVAATARQDVSHPAAWLPIVVRAQPQPNQTVKDVMHQAEPPNPADLKTNERRLAAVEDFARGVDLPPEKVMGGGDANHWAMAGISEDTYQAHVAPKVLIPTAILSEYYLRRQLMASIGLDPDGEATEEIDRFVIYPDATALIVHPNMSDNVKWAVGTERQPNFVMSLAGAREKLGIAHQYRAMPEEIDERMARAEKLNQGQAKGAEDAHNPVDPSSGQGMPGDDSSPKSGGDTGTPSRSNGQGASALDILALRIETAADTLSDRAVQRTGATLRNKARQMPEHADALATADTAAIPSRLGTAVCTRLLGDNHDPLAAEVATFSAKVLGWATDAHHPDPQTVVNGSVGLLSALTRSRLTNPGAEIKPGQVAAMVRS